MDTYELLFISKDNHKYTLRLKGDNIDILKKQGDQYITDKGWTQYCYKLKVIKKLDKDEL